MDYGIIPTDYQKTVKKSWFDIMRSDKRFDDLFERLDLCVVCREKAVDKPFINL